MPALLTVEIGENWNAAEFITTIFIPKRAIEGTQRISTEGDLITIK